MKEETKPEMTAEELAKKYFPISDGFGHRKTYVEVQKNLRNEFLADLRSVIRGETSELLKQRDELKEALAEQKRLYFSLFDEETSCMYCEAKIRRGSAIILCKECAESTEV